jgi:arylsulfatase A-like enzyme
MHAQSLGADDRSLFGCIMALPGSGLVAWEVTIANKLQAQGYRNACLGKWHMGEDVGRLPTDKGFDYWYGIKDTWDVSLWPEDKWFREEGMEPEYIVESPHPRPAQQVKVLDRDVRRDIDLDFLEKAERWMEDAVAAQQPFFIYFNHSNVHFPVLPREEYRDLSKGGPVGDCIQMIDGDFQRLLDKLDALGLRENTIVIFAGDNGRDTSFHAPGNRNAPGPWRGGYFSTFEGNNRTVCVARWPGRIAPRQSDEMMHITDWFPTLLNLIGLGDQVPQDRVIDGRDQSAFVTGAQAHSNRDHFHMFFGHQHVSMRYKNFKVLTYTVANGPSPIQKLAIPHVYNLTVDPDEDTPYNYAGMHSWVVYKIFGPKSKELQESLAKESVPFGAPLDFNPYPGRN